MTGHFFFLVWFNNFDRTHKTSLQSLAGTVAAVSFTDDLQKWHKRLQTIEAVLRVWLNVQQLWVQLEEVGGARV